MKKISRYFLLLSFITTILIIYFPSISSANEHDINDLKIHVINLNNTVDSKVNSEDTIDSEENRGDAILLESNGKYLLMDTALPNSYSYVKSYLDNLGVTELDLYISHIHGDHAGNAEAIGMDFRINNLYLPDDSIGTDFTYYDYYYNYVFKRCGAKNTIKLNKGSTFTFEDAKFDIIGPVKEFNIDDYPDREGRYLNNCSLVAIITCGNTKYFSAGDIEADAESALISEYGNDLKCDIMKMSHHAYSASNNEAFIDCIKPTYSFGQNYGNTGFVLCSDNKYRRSTYAKMSFASKYGLCIMQAYEKKDIIINIEDDNISIYYNSISEENKLSNWVEVTGADGIEYTTNKFYLDSNSKPLTGIQKIDGKLYNMGIGGCMLYGYFDSNKNYSGLRPYNNGYIYISNTGDLYTGWHVIYDTSKKINETFYFDLGTGLRYTGWHKIDNKYYLFNDYGRLQTSRWISEGTNKMTYVGSDGARYSGWKYIKDDKCVSYKYYFGSNGYRYLGLKKIGTKYYYFSPGGGRLCISKWINFGSKKYSYFDSTGARVNSGWVTTKSGTNTYKSYIYNNYRVYGLQSISGKLYFFNSYGHLKTNLTITISGVKCKFNKYGVLTSPIPTKVTLSSLTTSSKKATVSWKKATNASGYQIYYATSKNGTYKKASTVSYKTLKYTISGLTKGKYVYVKVRAYKYISGKYSYGSFSTVKYIKVK